MVLDLTRSRPHEVTTLAITGPDCAGKSTLAQWLKNELIERGYWASLIKADSYIRLRESRTGLPTEADDYYLNGFDLEQLLQDVGAIKKTFQSGEQSSTPKIILVEGVFLLKTEIAPNWDASIWLEITDDEILERGTNRDAEFFGSEEKARSVYETRIIPAQHIHRTRDLPKDAATSVHNATSAT
jgi:uridine kinase